VRTEESIFFIETSYPPRITGRKLCALESAARANRHKDAIFMVNSEHSTLLLPRKWVEGVEGNGLTTSKAQNVC